MTRNMLVWRKSIYENNFKCNQCGAKLFNPKIGQPTDNLAVDANAKSEEEKHLCFCAKCQNVVAKWQDIEVDEDDDANILRGSYSDWIEKKALDMKDEMQKRVEERLEKKYQNKITMLESSIKSKDAMIKRLKSEHEAMKKDKDEKIRKLYQDIEHSDKVIEKLQNELKQSLDERLKLLDLGIKED